MVRAQKQGIGKTAGSSLVAAAALCTALLGEAVGGIQKADAALDFMARIKKPVITDTGRHPVAAVGFDVLMAVTGQSLIGSSDRITW